MADLREKLLPALGPLLDPGELLEGLCVATQSSLFKGRMVAIGVTPRRLLIQGLTRKFEPDGEPTVLTPPQIASAAVEGAGGGWANLGAKLMEGAAMTLRLKTTEGEKLKLMMMRGTGLLGGLGGGEAQRQGVMALGAWFARTADG